MPTVSIIIVNWNRRGLLEECLASLQEQAFQDFEVIVVDNGSTDGSVELVQQDFPYVKLVKLPENRGFSIGNNIGILSSQGKYIALLNNDAVAEPGWLSALVSAMEQHPEVGFCASEILKYFESNQLESAGDWYSTVGLAGHRGEFSVDGGDYSRPAYVFGASAAGVIYRRSMLDDIGLFDEDFSPAYYEDVDLSFRAQLHGYRCLYVPDAVVFHRGHGTLGRESRQHIFLCNRNLQYVLFKNMPDSLLLRHMVDIVGYMAICSIWWGLQERTTAYFLGRVAAFMMLGPMLRKRACIQRARRVSPAYLESIMMPKSLWHAVTQFVGKRFPPGRLGKAGRNDPA